MTEALFILMALLSSWEEIIELNRDGSWQKDISYSFLFWETPYNSIWKNFDAKHVSFGAFILCTSVVLIQGNLPKYTLILDQWLNQFLGGLGEVTLILILWWAFMYVRNFGLHILLRRKGYRDWKYLSPFKFNN